MHQGLLIRQVFTMLELLLLVAVAGGAYLLLSRVLDKPATEFVSAVPGEGAASSVTFFELRPREEYKPVLDSGLFGEAGASGAVVDDKAPVPIGPERETKLP